MSVINANDRLVLSASGGTVQAGGYGNSDSDGAASTGTPTDERRTIPASGVLWTSRTGLNLNHIASGGLALTGDATQNLVLPGGTLTPGSNPNPGPNPNLTWGPSIPMPAV